ncbi:MAG TPA: C40 family peptidase [Gemmatimonadales bacterium]|nr:C40 family peptidase [Gemmatimonadales bacterium]
MRGGRTLGRIALGLLALGASTDQLPAQGVGVELGWLFAESRWTVYRVAYEQRILGPLGGTLFGTGLSAAGSTGDLYGLGGDLSLFRGGRGGPYLVGGAAGGFGAGRAPDTWSSWSAGIGYELFPLRFLSLSAEARWRELAPVDERGVQLSLRLDVVPGPRSRSPTPRYPAVSPITGAAAVDSAALAGVAERGGLPRDRAALAVAVVRTATEAMGTPYEWGGTGEYGEGFDCSGLIQYAFGRHGIALPRRSLDQARQGEEVPKALDALLPGDILTFSNTGGPVTHVGLYVGDGEFIHSASKGVQRSRLSPDDVHGRWWWRRWVGVRRVL